MICPVVVSAGCFARSRPASTVKDDHLVMTDTLLLNDADPDEIAASVSYLAETADYYERQLFGTDEH